MENGADRADGARKTWQQDVARKMWHAQDVVRARRGTRNHSDARCRNSMPPKTPTPKT
jgi:hypothetical protein